MTSESIIRARPAEDDRVEVEIRPLSIVEGHEGGRAVLSFEEAERLWQALDGAMTVGRLRRRLAANQRALDRELTLQDWR